jgi:hypothetical protein
LSHRSRYHNLQGFLGESLSQKQQAFNSAGLGFELRQSDFRDYRKVLSKSTKDQLVADAVARAANNFSGGCGLLYIQKGTRDLCSVDSYPTTLVLRKIASNLRLLTRSGPSERSRLIKVLLLFLHEETRFRLYRFDVRRFFDSLSVDESLHRVAAGAVSRKTVQLLTTVLREHLAAGRPGIPTGLVTSAALAEVMMAPFDEFVRKLPNVFYFGRFVDDIVIITNGTESPKAFEQELSAALPEGTRFGTDKLDLLDVPKVDHGKASNAGKFDYLGYEFTIRDQIVSNKKSERVVDVSLTERSLNRILTRIAKAFRTYTKDGRFDDLYLRICYLTSNFRLFDPLVNRKRLAGVYHNHPFLTYHEDNSLRHLDRTLRQLIFSNPQPRAGSGALLNVQQRRDLAARTFLRGHRERQYYSFSIKTLAKIKRCWFDG